jgi:hypothetical protein
LFEGGAFRRGETYDELEVLIGFDEIAGVEGRVVERVVLPIFVGVDVLRHHALDALGALGPIPELLEVLSEVITESLQGRLLRGAGELLRL